MFEQPGDQQIAPNEDATPGEGSDPNAEQFADAVDQQAQESSGTAAEAEPEVPDDASEKMREAQEHIGRLNMDEQRNRAKKAI